MPNWSENHTVFIGNEDTINHIYRAFNHYESEFDFNKLYPTPKVLGLYAAPATVLSPAEFTVLYDAPCPASIDEFIAFAADYITNSYDQDREGVAFGMLNAVPQPVFNQIVDTYGAADWYSWRNKHWGTKWSGSEAIIELKDFNLLAISYDTAWSPPEELFDNLLNDFPDLQIINGSVFEGYDETMEITRGTEEAFYTYFSVRREIEVYGLVGKNSADTTKPSKNAGSLDLDYHKATELNRNAVDTLIANNCLVSADGTVFDTTMLEQPRKL